MQGYEQTVFISYAWGGEREEIVNQIDQALQKRGIKISRESAPWDIRVPSRNLWSASGREIV